MGFSRLSVLLHAVLGAALVLTFCFGLYAAGLPFSPARLKQINWHKWAGICILAASVLRLAWRLAHPPPAAPANTPLWQQRAAQASHTLMYALFLAVPLAGWAYSSATGFPVVLFGVWPMPNWVPRSDELAATLKLAHWLLAYALASLVLLHVAAALYHHWVLRDRLLERMSLRRVFAKQP